MKAFKYFHSQYRASFESGNFFVNTFDAIRNQYENGLISDRTEAIVENRSGNIKIDDARLPAHQRTIDDLSEVGLVHIQGAVTDISISNSSATRQLPNAHMYCVSTERNDSYWRNLPEDQGGPYDCCLEFSDFIEFSKRLRSSIVVGCGCDVEMQLDNCFFESNKGIVQNGTTVRPSYFRKPHEGGFQEQNEMRAVFIPLEPHKLVPRLFSVDVAGLVTFHT